MPQIANIPLFTIKTRGSYLDAVVRNVYHYVDLAGAPSTQADVIAGNFETIVLVPAVANLSDQLSLTAIEVIQENDSENFHLGSLSLVGGNINPPLASNQVVSVRLNRTDRLFRNGWKRWSGLCENQVSGNFIEVASANQFAVDFAPSGEPFITGGNTLTPVILRRTYTGNPPVLNPVSQWLYSPIGEAQVFRRIGSQNTRKLGYGE